MKKLFGEETSGLNQGFREFKFISRLIAGFTIFLSIFFSIETFSQIPINGFCRYSRINISPGYNSIFPLNYNHDLFSDLLLYNSSSKKVELLKGDRDRSFSERKKIDIQVSISKIKNIYNSSREVTGYAFTSRKQMMSGIYNIDNKGDFELQSVKKFASYPDNINAGDVNLNGESEILVSGSAFEGLSLLYQSNMGLEERKIISKASYSVSVFLDLNNDGYPDIASFNLLSNTLDMFYNNSRGVFNLTRSIPEDDRITFLAAADFDHDSFNDLIYVKKNNIVIMYGDFTSSYDSIVTINTVYHPDKFVIGDFNKDRLNDIAYIDTTAGILSVIFSKSKFEFYPEIVYFQKDKIRDVANYSDNILTGLAVIDSKGNLYLISDIKKGIFNYDISIGRIPSHLKAFDYGNNGQFDFCFNDDFNNNLIIILRNKYGIPSVYYSYPLFEHHSRMFVDDSEPMNKTFYLYEQGKKLIEIVKVNFSDNKFERSSLYSPGGIRDLRVKVGGGKPEIYVANSIDGKLNLARFDFNASPINKYSYFSYGTIASNTLSESIVINNSILLYYWQLTNGSIKEYRYNLQNEKSGASEILNFPVKNNFSIMSFAADVFNQQKENNLSFIRTDEKTYLAVSSDASGYIVSNNEELNQLRIKDENQLFFGKMNYNGLKRLFVYQPEGNSIKDIEFSSGSKKISISDFAEAENAGSYFIKNYYLKEFGLVYINKEENCLTFTSLR